MKNLFKTLALIGVALCLSLGVLAFAACSEKEDNNDGEVTYTVTVTCTDNSSILNLLNVQLRDSDGNVVATSKITKASAAATSGTATATLQADTYSVYLVETAGNEGVLAEEELVYAIKTVTKDNKSVTVELAYDTSDNKVTYTVTFLNADNTPAANTSVSLCGGPIYSCYPQITGTDGVAVFTLPAGEYEVHVGADATGTMVTVTDNGSTTVTI